MADATRMDAGHELGTAFVWGALDGDAIVLVYGAGPNGGFAMPNGQNELRIGVAAVSELLDDAKAAPAKADDPKVGNRH